MSRDLIACPVQDLSAFTKALRSELKQHLLTQSPAAAEPPSHLALMNMVARAAGHRNVQALKAVPAAPVGTKRPLLVTMPAPAHGPRQPALSDNADRALRQFDEQGRLMRWPSKYSIQRLTLWGLWMAFDGKRSYREAEVNEILKRWHSFGDHCTLRRELINMKLLSRSADSAVYRKQAARPDEEVTALLGLLRARQQQG
ncbi:DUF2087 domain-containing protein [Paucibacter sp. APW11]|uniref:DUF2087 domain-containing protein n=1 Tax=Roseateles aquae TaxID=3077235 RepID=A0ABU3P7M5_9BURK|nr:DUF2087 domain-containing protein [Paucibacter sp. APW11]MDT8998108.1 DUF2087 domain-containing protein [Paucibacter sp. APW11]